MRSRIHANRRKHYEKPEHRKLLDQPPPTIPIADSHFPPQQCNAQDTENDVREDELQPTGEPDTEAQTTPDM